MNTLLEHLGHIADVLVIVVPFWLWLNKWAKRIESSVNFSKEVAKTHLPHVYWRLRRSDDTLKLPVVEHPDIVFLNGNGNGVSPSRAAGHGA